MNINDLRDFPRGHRLKAAELNVHVALLREHDKALDRKHEAPFSCFDPDGWYQRRLQADSGSLRPFELKSSLDPANPNGLGTHAWAYPRVGDPARGYTTNIITRQTTTTDPDTGEVTVTVFGDNAFLVYDVLGIWRGRGRDDFPFPHEVGSIGWAQKIDGYWVVVEMQKHALMIRGFLTSPLLKANAGFDIEGVKVMSPIGAIITDKDPGSEDFKVLNRAFDGDQGSEAIIAWDESEVRWLAIDVLCPAACANRTDCS